MVAIAISQLVDGFIVGPKIIGNKVGLNTFWVIVSMIIFGNLFGIVGMFLGAPIMSILKLFYIDLLKKAEYVDNVEIIPVPRNAAYTATKGETTVDNTTIKNYILSKCVSLTS